MLFNIPIISTISNINTVTTPKSFNRMKLRLNNVNDVGEKREFNELKGMSIKRNEKSYLFVTKEEEEVNSDYPLTVILKGKNDIEIEMKKEEYHKEYSRLKRIIERKNYIRGSGITQVILYFHFIYLLEISNNKITKDSYLDEIINKIMRDSYLDSLILLFKNHDVIIEHAYDIVDGYMKEYYQQYKDLVINNRYSQLSDFVMKLPSLIENELIDDMDSAKYSFVGSIHVLMNILSISERISRIK